MKLTTSARAAAGLALSLMAIAPAAAADAGTADTNVKVSRAFVTPASAQAAQRSLARLGEAAMEACGASFFSLPDYKDAIRRSSCWQTSMSDAVAQVGNPYLTAAYQRGTVELSSAQGGASTHAR